MGPSLDGGSLCCLVLENVVDECHVPCRCDIPLESHSMLSSFLTFRTFEIEVEWQ